MVLFVFCLVCVSDSADAKHGATYGIEPGEDVQFRLQGRLIEAVPGDVIQLEEGVYELRRQLDIVADNITIRGRGSNKTILSFKRQNTGGQGIEATGNNFVLEGLAVEDTAGNAIKVNGAKNVTFRDIRTEWTGPALASNGAYGLYPVQCDNVLIDNCAAIGASDAGLYVGQCRNVIVRSSRAERNVAGIEIENTINADVYDNVATNNAGGILVFDLPGLPQKSGRNVRVFRNRVIANNHVNFAAAGNMVATVPSGTGIMVMATDRVEVFNNQIQGNQTSSVSIVSFLVTGKKVKDAEYDAIPETVFVHHNRISGGGTNPQGEMREQLIAVLGEHFPDILYDGIVNPLRFVDGQLPPELGVCIRDNGDATFANFNLAYLSPENIAAGKYRVERDLKTVAYRLEPLPPVRHLTHDPPQDGTSPAVEVYRAAPRNLSEYGLFVGNGATQQPAEGVVPYDLNTSLFSDYTSKRRFIRVPAGKQMEFREQGVFEFPVGTVIAKTFSYPHDMRDPAAGEQLMETRIELKEQDGWYGFSYIWNETQTEAKLALGGSERDVSWIHNDGQQRTSTYQIPNANQCLNCHNESKKYVPIGPTATNLNREFDFLTGKENQLEHMARLKVLRGKPSGEHIDRLASFDDSHSGTVDERARAWLAVNCAHCHSPTGTARTSGLDLTRSQTDPAKYGVWKTPVAAGHGSGGREYDIVPGKPDESILMFRLESEDPSIMMPNVARSLVPEEGVQLLRQWIAEMQGT